MLRSLKDKLKFNQVLIDDAFDATAATSSVDLADFNSLSFLVSVGTFAFTGTDKLSLVVQHSDDDAAWANATDADIFDAEDGDNGVAKILDAGTDDESVHAVHYRGNKRYARLNIVEAGTVSVVLDVVAVRGHSELMPPL
jgi:hypothetical protein